LRPLGTGCGAEYGSTRSGSSVTHGRVPSMRRPPPWSTGRDQPSSPYGSPGVDWSGALQQG